MKWILDKSHRNVIHAHDIIVIDANVNIIDYVRMCVVYVYVSPFFWYVLFVNFIGVDAI